jgi:hypothetical protein
MRGRASPNRGLAGTYYDMNHRQCSSCLVIPFRLHTVVTGHTLSHLCDSCYSRYNAGQTVIPAKSRPEYGR